MTEYLIPAACIAFAIGYYLGRFNTIKLNRRLYNLGANFNLVYAEFTEKDKVFNTIFDESSERKDRILRGIK